MTITRGLTAVLAGAVLLLTGCGSAEAPPADPPSTLEAVAGSDVQQVVLSEAGEDAVGIRTAQVTAGPAAGRLTVPYGAVLYYLDGSTWTYTRTAPRSYLRVPITVASISGGTAILTAGPPVGTEVVLTGSTELLGAELEIAGEQ